MSCLCLSGHHTLGPSYISTVSPIENKLPAAKLPLAVLLKGPAALLGLSLRNSFLAMQGPSTTKKINSQKIAEKTINMFKSMTTDILYNPHEYEYDNSLCMI